MKRIRSYALYPQISKPLFASDAAAGELPHSILRPIAPSVCRLWPQG
jgi:hypothetical protein